MYNVYDILIFLTGDVETLLQRANKRDEKKDDKGIEDNVIQKKGLEFQKKVKSLFEDSVPIFQAEMGERFIQVNVDGKTEEEILEEVVQKIQGLQNNKEIRSFRRATVSPIMTCENENNSKSATSAHFIHHETTFIKTSQKDCKTLEMHATMNLEFVSSVPK